MPNTYFGYLSRFELRKTDVLPIPAKWVCWWFGQNGAAMRYAKMIERRNHKRFEVREGAIVVHEGHCGQILDISLGGLACQCIGHKNFSENSSAFDIFCANDLCKFKLKDVPIQMITNYINQLSPWNTALLRRCGVMFGELTADQKTHLENFIHQLSLG